MTWWQTLIVALSTLIVTKGIDFFISFLSEKRNFQKYRRERIYEEIEELKNEVGKIYELAANWMAFDAKQQKYVENFISDYELIGKFNKHPPVANAARDTIHWCKIVAHNEKKQSDDLIENKKELSEKFRVFLDACEDYINKLA